MTPLEIVTGLAAGDPAAARALLPACRAQAYGAEAFGPAAIGELFARHAAPLSPTPDVVEGAHAWALFDTALSGAEQAWFADLHDGRIARLWRLGAGDLDPAAEPALAFAADAFLSQQRESVAFRAEDHPDLDPAAGEALAQACAAAATGSEAGSPAAQGRVFVVRALSEGDRAAALVSVTGLASRVAASPRLAAISLRLAQGAAVHARTVWDVEREGAVRSAV